MERLFWYLKKKGFDLEATHIRDITKLDKLFAVVTLAFIISFAWGCHLQKQTHFNTSEILRKSFFWAGLEDILKIFQPLDDNHKRLYYKRKSQQQRFKQSILNDLYHSISLV